jgi:hypothetical protein
VVWVLNVVEVLWVVRVMVWNIHSVIDVMLSVLIWLNVSLVVIGVIQFVVSVVVNMVVYVMMRGRVVWMVDNWGSVVHVVVSMQILNV